MANHGFRDKNRL